MDVYTIIPITPAARLLHLTRAGLHIRGRSRGWKFHPILRSGKPGRQVAYGIERAVIEADRGRPLTDAEIEAAFHRPTTPLNCPRCGRHGWRHALDHLRIGIESRDAQWRAALAGRNFVADVVSPPAFDSAAILGNTQSFSRKHVEAIVAGVIRERDAQWAAWVNSPAERQLSPGGPKQLHVK